ncbi:TonB-dependent receptor [Novosphingobium album (ex Liu et al. 2023)]|uniref:TonB-dependent receptor n=1 Tax=Novosphingobium album (ex Liu et al. 2023) TaxID=3031130 RepID=A0ABT5WKZ3_9SPHN|nr:TonB-dependent receptor [Novosphingobium album (ex Liu et al. 2023)]MDE8650710.1 TonB-dependent receptor [Novosphingobium album (ex Liu et al. 2023)]
MKYWLSVGCCLAALASGRAHAQSSPSGADTADAQPTDIVVTGYRESIEAARDAKRDSAAVTDSIVAEDIAAFPQANLSEAVQRISGVQIRRDFAGAVGNEISIRGLGPEYTQVTINGQAAPTNGEDRTFNFNILPADMFRKVEVLKSPTADTDEGGVGGTVALETIRPLDLKDRLLAVSAGGNYNEITDKLDPRGSLVAGGRLAPNFGVIGSLSIDNFAAASQSYDAVRWTRSNLDVNGDKVNDYNDVFVMYPRMINERQDVRRISASGRIEWEPTDKLTILVDGLYTNFRQDYERTSPIWNFPGGKTVKDIHVDGSVVDYISFGSVVLRSENHKTLRQTEMYQGSAAAEYKFGDWRLKGFASKSRSTQDSEEFVYFGDKTAAAAYDTRDDIDYYEIISPTNIADPAEYTTSEARRNLINTRDDDFSGGLELKGPAFPHVTLKLGVKYRDRQRTRERYAVTRTKINEPFSLIGDVLTGFLDDEPGAASGPHAFAISDFDKAYQLYGSKLDISTGTDLTNFFDVEEKTWSGYGMATYRHGPWLANAGLRVVHTSVTSNGIEYNKGDKTSTERNFHSEYADFLPSLNLRYELTKGLFLRAAAARVMTRPSLSDLAAYRTIDDANLIISAKNPDLKPFRANQFDLAAEWYFGKGGLLSAGYFYKDIESFIVTESVPFEYNGQTYELRHPVNGNNARVQGVEVNYQQPFTFLPGPLRNLGIVANYTFTDSSFRDTVSGTTLAYGLPENSRHSFNLIGYYEDKDLSLRIAYNYRSKFLREKPNEQDGLKYRSAYGQADFAARYKLLPNLALTLDVLNLFSAETDEWVYEPRLTDGRFTTGRTVQFGLRASF